MADIEDIDAMIAQLQAKKAQLEQAAPERARREKEAAAKKARLEALDSEPAASKHLPGLDWSNVFPGIRAYETKVSL